jgi:hypothetical protein
LAPGATQVRAAGEFTSAEVALDAAGFFPGGLQPVTAKSDATKAAAGMRWCRSFMMGDSDGWSYSTISSPFIPTWKWPGKAQRNG